MEVNWPFWQCPNCQARLIPADENPNCRAAVSLPAGSLDHEPEGAEAGMAAGGGGGTGNAIGFTVRHRVGMVWAWGTTGRSVALLSQSKA
jgi:hypothetical protein